MPDTGGLYYIHERIDQLVRQTALEVGLLRLHLGVDTVNAEDPREGEKVSMQLTRQRFWAAQDAAADNHHQEHREP
jgi:hypothetical protein